MTGGRMFYLGAAIWGCSVILCPLIGHMKGRSAFGWFLAGLFFGPVAVLIVIVIPWSDELKREGDTDRRRVPTEEDSLSQIERLRASGGPVLIREDRSTRQAKELERLAEMHARGALSDDAYRVQVDRLMRTER
jgi:hypothetical protein